MIITRSVRTIAAIGSCLALVLVGCAPTRGHRGTSDTAIVGVEGNPITWNAALAREYDSLAAVAAKATIAVEGTARGSRIERVSGVPFSVTTVAVNNVLKGEYSGATVEVRQFGDQYNTADELAPVLVRSRKYLLYLQPFEFRPGISTGQWVIVGGIAAWQDNGFGTYQSLVASNLPPTITAANVKSSSS